MNGRVVLTGDQAVAQLGLADDGLTVVVCLAILAGMYITLLIMAFFALKRSIRNIQK